MKQLLQNSKSGEFSIPDIPIPQCQPNGVLVQTAFSLISAGTEKSSVSTAKASMVGKAKSRPDLVAKVIDQIKKQGIVETYKLVKDRLDAPMQLGYSSAGIVIDVGDNVSDLVVGDRVACAGGGYASHAEVNYIPRNLVAKIPENLSFENAAYGTLGAIAMQGIRQAGVTVGETVAVIGLGLLGQISVQILKAAGCRVIGLDISEYALKIAGKKTTDSNNNESSTINANKADLVVNSTSGDVAAQVAKFTNGFGVDKVVVTAATKDNAPLLQAGSIIRDRGTIVVVGAVPVNIPRSPFYEKEVELKFSRSYGPGRYDANYEEKGRDYPIGYVRWTENRNIESFLQLIADGKIDVSGITTHAFPLEKAPEAYKMILERSEPFLGILLDYKLEKAVSKTQENLFVNSKSQTEESQINIGFVGLGKFAQSFLLPGLKSSSGVNLQTVINATGVSANAAMERNNFSSCGSDAEQIFSNGKIDTVFIASRHDSHAQLVIKSLQANKHTFVEKPLCLKQDELRSIREAYEQGEKLKLMVGYNRRFAPLSIALKKALSSHSRPMSIFYRVNTGMIPADHWTNDPEIGGGRILGEVCHFIDYSIFLAASKVVRVQANAINYNQKDIPNQNSVAINLAFENGAIATIHYLCDGDRSVPKEWIEVMGDNKTYQINDFRNGFSYSGGTKTKMTGGGRQDKGHANEIAAFIESLKSGTEAPISSQDIFHGMDVTFAVLQSIRNGQVINL
ncbi:MAG: bi-domain-containing oxidoreductase [Deferribacteres bacterium]|nr:bi-domain-containing oxidoreductase [candidate division KSB1 bacterium]MCB9503148.1 bi-domain-containing oxidoreductase [Deferribacteres bacterium]